MLNYSAVSKEKILLLHDDQQHPKKARQKSVTTDNCTTSGDYQNSSSSNQDESLHQQPSNIISSNGKRSKPSSSSSSSIKKMNIRSVHIKTEQTAIKPRCSLYHQITSKLSKQGISESSSQGTSNNIISINSNNRRSAHSSSNQTSSSNLVKTEFKSDINGQSITATIIASFNAGDIDEIDNIITSQSIPLCEVYFSTLNHVLIGRSAFFSLWSAILVAFPNGIFRPSPTIVNENQKYLTNFLFFGTKIYPLLIDGVPVELQHSSARLEPVAINSASFVVDTSRILFSSSELEETEEIPEMLFEGFLIIDMNEDNKIRKVEFSWSRKKEFIATGAYCFS